MVKSNSPAASVAAPTAPEGVEQPGKSTLQFGLWMDEFRQYMQTTIQILTLLLKVAGVIESKQYVSPKKQAEMNKPWNSYFQDGGY
jgi:hypothetical protein